MLLALFFTLLAYGLSVPISLPSSFLGYQPGSMRLDWWLMPLMKSLWLYALLLRSHYGSFTETRPPSGAPNWLKGILG